MITMTWSIFVSSNNFFINLFIFMKMSKNSWAKFYQNIKERLQKNVCKRYQSLSKRPKEKQWQYYRERCKNLPEDVKQKLVEYRKKYIIKWVKTSYYSYKKLLSVIIDEEWIKAIYQGVFEAINFLQKNWFKQKKVENYKKWIKKL